MVQIGYRARDVDWNKTAEDGVMTSYDRVENGCTRLTNNAN